MFDKQEFVKSVFKIEQLPKSDLAEVILCGRSNVGKSTFINSLFNRKNLAKTSSTPGKTRSINYYLIDEKFYVVDLPGYGYAKTSMKEREYWGKLINEFISKNKNIKLALHLIDSRHEPTELDIKLNQLMNEFGVPYLVVLTKADKLKQSDFATAKRRIKKFFPELKNEEGFIFYSSVNKRGKREILSLLKSQFIDGQ